MRRVLQASGRCGLALAGWGILGYLVIVANVGAAPLISPGRVAATGLLLFAPALTFGPLARRLGAPLYDIEGVVGWASCGYVLIFLAPRATPSLGQFLIFLLPLTIALASVCSLLAYLVGLRVLLGDPRAHDFVRARRQGYLAALCIVALGLLHGAGLLTPAIAVLLVGLAILTELLAQSAWRGAEWRSW
jgi:hypothetical protein